MNNFGMQNITPEQQKTNEELQYIASYGQQAFNERKLIELSAKEKSRLRDEFAMAALGSLIQKLNFTGGYREEIKGDSIMLANSAYLISDAMLKAREVKR